MPDAKARRAAIEASEAMIEEQLRLGPAQLSVLREGRRLDLQLDSRPACPARVRLARSRQPNAFANGRYAIVTTQVMAFTRSDDELAIIVAHEVAHNILEHKQKLDEQGVPKGLFRRFGKNAGRIRATEEEADRLGVQLLAAAGYDTAAIIPFWRRFYARYDSPQLFRTHPGLKAREKLIGEELARIAASNLRPQRP
jgi:predicted Zn-dependent protease